MMPMTHGDLKVTFRGCKGGLAAQARVCCGALKVGCQEQGAHCFGAAREEALRVSSCQVVVLGAPVELTTQLGKPTLGTLAEMTPTLGTLTGDTGTTVPRSSEWTGATATVARVARMVSGPARRKRRATACPAPAEVTALGGFGKYRGRSATAGGRPRRGAGQRAVPLPDRHTRPPPVSCRGSRQRQSATLWPASGSMAAHSPGGRGQQRGEGG